MWGSWQLLAENRIKSRQMKMRIPTRFTAFLVFGFLINPSLQGRNTIICENIVPVILPSYVTRVYISIFSVDIHFSEKSFFHESWRNVTLLDITAKYKSQYGNFDTTFGSVCFGQISALRELRIHGDEISRFSLDTFDKIKHLQELQFSECSYLEISNVVAALFHANITMDTLSLNDISNAIGETLTLNALFYELIQKMEVKSLSLRKSIFKINNLENHQIKPSNLKALDISQTTMLIPENIKTIHKLYDMIAPFLFGLKTLNISSIPNQFFQLDNDFLNNKIIRNCFALNHQLMKVLFLSVENLYTDALFRTEVTMNNTVLNISDCRLNLKKWHFKRNKVQSFNMSIYLPPNNAITEIDLSFNEIKYVSPLAFHSAKSLKVLKLRSNELFQMEALPEFNDLLSTLFTLQHYSIADNKISKLPRDIFMNNFALEVIDLADNNLQSITFTLKHLLKLKTLKIARNRIKYLDGKALSDIKSFFKSRASAGSNQTTVIDMAGNPFICNCDSVAFIEWIISFVQQHSRRKYECTMANEVTKIDEDALHFSNYLCYQTTIITCTSIAIGVLISMIILLTRFILRRRRKQKEKCERKLFLKDFQKGDLPEQYLCQISYSSEDEMCALDVINTQLNTVLNRKCHCRRDIICIGDKNFCLGRSIVDEIIRCISESCVIIFVISKSFCESRWCEMELKEAYEMGKPIILIFKEEVKTDLMSTLLLTVFNRITRAKLVENEGKVSLVPEWESLGESIIKLATEQFIAKQKHSSSGMG